MKKIIFLLAISIGLISCEKESFEPIENNTNLESTTKEDIFVFKDWEEFRDLYDKFSSLDTEELQAVSFFTYDKNPNMSWAFQGILNKDNQFIVADKTIWVDNGKFYELDGHKALAEQKSNKNLLKQVGSVSQAPIASSSQGNLAKTVAISNQHQFRKQKYIENCGAGITQGPSPRAFKYVHEAFAETISYGSPLYRQYLYRLSLRVKLEYNHRGNSWRASGEGRDIEIRLTNNSFLTNHLGQNLNTGGGSTVIRNITFSNSCHSDKQQLLSSINAAGPIPNSFWSVNVSGTVTEKMFGDVESNRWKDTINW
ncbi:hypothetical protein [uncultured Aquimarina sp.]|uniref:hypothetical protein n=1 Tax=uncultured Aquimarina sp. TaxID=575652 RepID=UPI00261AF69C|nr:hypothetical protein [uncultured Aquimarina sp.]